MLLPHLLPFLDAEIDRLQRARDLLAAPCSPILFNLELADVQTWLAQKTAAPEPQPMSLPWATKSRPAVVATMVAHAAQEAPPVKIVRPYDPHRTARKPRSRPAADTALRGAVPAGPVVVSAEAVRQEQVAKSAPATASQAADLAAFSWRHVAPGHDGAPGNGRDLNSLLQKFIDIGSEKKTLPPLNAGPLFG